jgi:hypothetical protein
MSGMPANSTSMKEARARRPTTTGMLRCRNSSWSNRSEIVPPVLRPEGEAATTEPVSVAPWGILEPLGRGTSCIMRPTIRCPGRAFLEERPWLSRRGRMVPTGISLRSVRKLGPTGTLEGWATAGTVQRSAVRSPASTTANEGPRELVASISHLCYVGCRCESMGCGGRMQNLNRLVVAAWTDPTKSFETAISYRCAVCLARRGVLHIRHA